MVSTRLACGATGPACIFQIGCRGPRNHFLVTFASAPAEGRLVKRRQEDWVVFWKRIWRRPGAPRMAASSEDARGIEELLSGSLKLQQEAAVSGKVELGKLEGAAEFGSKVEAGKLELPAEGVEAGKVGTILGKGELGTSGKVVEVEGQEAESGGSSKEAAGRGSTDALIFLAERAPQHAEGVLQTRHLKLPEGSVLVGADEHKDKFGKGFDVDAYFAELQTSQFGALLLFASHLPSTHSILSQNWSAFPQGTVCVADVQYQGKGRAGNVWESPKGCLMFSFTLQMEDGRKLPFLQYVVSLAIVDGIEAYCFRHELPSPGVRIKWPNDLYAKGLKIGGILCTSTYSSKRFNVVVGVGLNVSNRKPTTCLEALLEEQNAQPHVLNRVELLAIIFNRFEELFHTFTTGGFTPLEASYYTRWLHSGQKVELEEKKEDGTGVSQVPVTIQGLTSSGFLLASNDQDEHFELHPDGNSFDFLKGLVRKKLPV